MPTSAAPLIRARDAIRVRVLAATAVLALAGIGFAGNSLRGALVDRQDAQALEAASTVLAGLSRATIELSLERSASQLAIEVPNRIDPAVRRLIDEQRRKADTGLDQVVAQAASLTTTTKAEEFRRGVGALREKLIPLRAAFDRLTALPLAERPAAQVESLPRDLKAIVVEFQSQRNLLRGPGLNLPTEIGIIETIRDQAWQIREYGGRERTYLIIAIATRAPIGAARLEEMAVLARRTFDAWGDIEQLMRYEGQPEALRTAEAAVKAGFFGRYDDLRRTMLEAAHKPQPSYPLDFDRFFAASSEALHGVEALAAAASTAIEDYWSARADATLRAVILDSVAVLLVLAAAVAGSLLILRAFGRIDALRASMQRLAEGDIEAEVAHAAAKDEVGAMARTVMVFRETARERRALEAEAAREQAEKDRRQAAMERHVRGFTERLSAVTATLSEAATRMDGASRSMAEAAERTGDLARSTTEGAQSSARDLVTVASATEELTASVAEISRQVSSAAATAQGMATHANGTEQTMSGLAQAADRIGEVARLIGDIAGQTNLLALNATIEAARAGEAGKGFAVVASEVKQLAGRTATATGEIASQIGAIQAATKDAVAAVRQMATEVRRMEEMASAIAAAVEEQGAGVREIAGSIATVTRATEDAVGAMREAASAAENARATSGGVRDAAGEVGRESGTLGREVEQFLAVILENQGQEAAPRKLAA